VPGVGPVSHAVLLLHGARSVFEFIEFIPRLTDPARSAVTRATLHRRGAALPGYGLSFRPGQRRFGVSRNSRLCRGPHA